MSFELGPRQRFVLRRELPQLHLGPREELLWAGVAYRGRRQGLLACTTTRVVWIRSRLLGSQRRSWDLALVQRLEVVVQDVERAAITMQARTARLPYHFTAERRDAKAFAAAVDSTTPEARQRGRKATDERLARLERMVSKGTMTEAEAKLAAERIVRDPSGSR